MVLTVILLFLGVNAAYAISENKFFDEHRIKIESAIRVANTKLSQLGKSDSFFIEDTIQVCSDDGSVLFYLFNLQPQGYIAVSADYDLPPVIAYSFTNNFNIDDSRGNILQMLKTDIELRLKNVPSLPENVIESRNLLWDELSRKTELSSKTFQQWPPEGTTSTGGWLETNWHQDSPYNNFCPLDKNGQRSVAGCPAVAMAQILNYHERINNITFNDTDDYYHNYAGNQYWIDDDHESYDFPSFPELNNYLATLAYHYQNQIPLTDDDKAALTFACGVAAQQVYTSEVSGTFGVNQAHQAYMRLGINGIELLDENDANLYGRLRMNMIDGLPAHLAVVTPDWNAGHNLVVDGYNTDGYYHLNFGWGGYGNGWYLLPDEMPYGLTVIEGIIVDIMKNNSGADVYCTGGLIWTDISPGDTVTGSFTVENVGEPGSLLNWGIDEYPEWGTWTFTPSGGENLTPEDGTVNVEVSVVAPDKKIRNFEGYIKIVNEDDGNDCFILQVSLTTPIQNHLPALEILKHLALQLPILKKIFDYWQIVS